MDGRHNRVSAHTVGEYRPDGAEDQKPNAPAAISHGRHANIGQRSRYQVGQLVGARNSRPAPEVVKVVGTFVEEINNRVRVAS
jgi:hypothetical protein